MLEWLTCVVKWAFPKRRITTGRRSMGGLGVSELHRLKQLEEENQRLKWMIAGLSLNKQILQDALSKKL
ncbi:hypothetical protein VIBNISOn1_1890003 [Vibrio nigripulchritudo SOn1]|uniref:Transposase n=1 Tax=Vibrio nigripulchritudo SOn1 TaxID=1238450 RepID=A0AAV2VPV0_9VIBR|nr:hypothetical protein VIBNISOn1_1890003 [Vibrio nigripulchritudo SOn1]